MRPSAEFRELLDIAHKLRIDTIYCTNKAKSGHPTSCSSIAEIMSVLFFKIMQYKVKDPKDPASDRFILSKGHAAPILYAAWAEAGLFPVEKLMTLRTLYSDLEGHPSPRLNFIDVGTGSLGHGLSIAAGMAYVGKKFDKANYRVYCVMGDGESMEGSVWEAVSFACYYKLDNLCAVIDVNRLGQTGPTTLAHDTDTYYKRFEAFGFNALVVDGHNIEDLVSAFESAANTKGKPTVLIAKTFKGKHFPGVENLDHWHGKPLGDKADKVIDHLKSLIWNKGPITLAPCPPVSFMEPLGNTFVQLSTPPNYKKSDLIATRNAYGIALVKIAQNNPRVVALDGDTKTLTNSDKLRVYDRSRFIECFVAEQNMLDIAIGVCCRGRTIPFVSTFGAFWTRAFDQIRMGAISQSNINICGSHCGVTTGEDGPSQMAMEDLAMFRCIPGSTIFYPSDAVACERAVELAANTRGITYIRTNRPDTPIIYPNDKVFHVGQAQIVRQQPDDQVLIITGGITLHEALKAADTLDCDGIHVRIMDLFTVKPIDKKAIIANASDIGGHIITVEDHYPQGGIGEAVLSTVAEEPNITVKLMAVPKVPRSGKPLELLDYFGISACNIVLAVNELVSKKINA